MNLFIVSISNSLMRIMRGGGGGCQTSKSDFNTANCDKNCYCDKYEFGNT
jgi:hypothetical protein